VLCQFLASARVQLTVLGKHWSRDLLVQEAYYYLLWHHALPSYLSQELERIQKGALKIMVPALSYSDALH